MIYYKNISLTTKTFYGVEFKPGDTHGVPGYITHPKMHRVSGDAVSMLTSNTVESTKSTRGRKKKCTIEEPAIEVETSNAQIDLIKNKIEEELDNGSN